MKAMDCGETRCFAHDGMKNRCRVLYGDGFKKACPFFKTKAEYKAGLAKWAEYYGKEMLK